MTRRDFILIASVIRDADLSNTGRRRLALAFAAQLAATHERFDRDKFLSYVLDNQ
jgi:hypothetical protein